jgi:hypothetical protein
VGRALKHERRRVAAISLANAISRGGGQMLHEVLENVKRDSFNIWKNCQK